MKLTKILIANRGEIACRVIRSAHALGYATVAVYSDADADAPHVAMADQAVRLGPAPATSSYLNVDAILDAARLTGADGLHPGYGFLAENAGFAALCADAGITFIGPSPDAIAIMGDKAQAKRMMLAANVPCVPGYDGDDQSDEALSEAAAGIGFPLLVKAAAGGGGRGMRKVLAASELAGAIRTARAEAQSAFGNGHLLLERLVENARHVEIQVMGDHHGHIIHLGERDCSTQRRYQKVIEEAPCPVVGDELRARMGAAAVAAARAVNYVGAGTVELLLAEDQSFYFLEMNTRLQVEHPVTELVTGLDLVAMQLRVAAGEALGISQDEVILSGHAIEARLYAEDPSEGHRPQMGTIAEWIPAEGDGIRVDHGLASGLTITPFYDSMVAKVIAVGESRDEAIRRLQRALSSTIVLGLNTNRLYLKDILAHPAFASGSMTTGFLGSEAATELHAAHETPTALWALAAVLHIEPDSDGWRTTRPTDFPVELVGPGEEVRTVRVIRDGDAWVCSQGESAHRVREPDGAICIDGVRSGAHAVWTGETVHIHHNGVSGSFHERQIAADASTAGGDGLLKASMSGVIVSVEVAVGDVVTPDQTALTLEAMKIASPMPCGVAGTVTEVRVGAGDQVSSGQTLVIIEPAVQSEVQG